MLRPLIDDDGAPFFEYAAKGELRMQTCAACGEVRFPPRPMCPLCQSPDSAWKVTSGRGTVWSFAVPHPPLLPDYAEFAPYPVVVVELAEDRRLRMVGNLVPDADAPINALDPAAIAIGMPVRVAFTTIEDVAVACWTPDE